MSNPDITRFQSIDGLADAAAVFICERAEAAVAERGRFAFALSGGRTPRPVYERLAQSPFVERMPWRETHLFWSDERCVPQRSPDSNFGMAYASMIAKVPIPVSNVHVVPGELDAESAADSYEKVLHGFFSDVPEGCFPAFDLILLGLGADGHTASLYPGDPAVIESRRWVAAVETPGMEPMVSRVTFTLPLINGARCVLFLAGKGKGDLVDEILSGADAANKYPAAMVRPRGELVWYVTS